MLPTEFPRILIAGTLPADADVFVETLRRQSLNVETIPEREDVIAFSASIQPDLLLLGEMRSHEIRRGICQELKKSYATRHIPIIVLCDSTSPGDQVESADDYIFSPLLSNVAVKRVETHLRLRLMQKQLDEKEHQLQQYRKELQQQCLEGEHHGTACEQHESVLLQHAELSRRFTHFAATAPGVMYTCNLREDGSFVFPYASPGIENLCGLKPEVVISDIDAFIARIHSADFERFCAEMRKSARDSSLFYCEFRVSHPVNGMIWAEARATAIREADGSTLWHGFMTDITERKLTEEKLWASEQSLQAIVDHSPDVLVRYDREFRRVYISRSYINAHGISGEEVLGKRPSDFWLSSSMTAAEFEHALDQVMAQGVLSDIEFDWVKDTGEVTHHWLRAVPEYDREGNVVSVLALARDISAMKRAEADLAAHESDLRALVEHIPDNIVRYDRDACIRYINPVMAKTLGVAQEEVIGKHGRELLGRLDTSEYFAALEQVLQTGRPADFLLVAGKGVWKREVYDNIRFAPEFSSDGEVIGAIAIGRDLSVQRKLELEVALREQEFRNLADNMPDMIVRYDRLGMRVYCNHAYMNNHPVAISPLGKTIFESWWLKTPTPEEYMVRLEQVMETGTPLEFTVSWDGTGGEPEYLMMHLVPDVNQDGEVNGVLAIGRNITRLMRTEALLRKREQEFRTLAQNSPDMIVRYDLECRRVYINPSYSYYTGISIDDALNQSPSGIWTSLMPCTEYIERLQRVMRTRQPDRMLLEWIMPDGSIASHLMHAVAEFDENGEVSGALVIGHNITELKATERRLEDSRVQLQRLTYHREEAREEERRRVAREIHDELGQLLSVLRLGISTLDYRYGDANPDLRNKTAKMGNVIDQAIDMIHTLATRLRPAVIESGIMLAVEWLVQEFSKSTGIRCEFDIPKTEIDLDKDNALALFRIVQESMTNILRHAEATHVVVALSQYEQALTLEISDNGKGFVPEKIGKSGTFGIIGMQERVLMMDGTLVIDSAPGKGTVLRIIVPLKSALEKEIS